jgi:hypothetical protein
LTLDTALSSSLITALIHSVPSKEVLKQSSIIIMLSLTRTVVILSVLVSVGAFVVSPQTVTRTRTANSGNVESDNVWKSSTSTSTLTGAGGPLLMAKKGKVVVPEGKPASSALKLLSPLNPYMLFVYPILFIFAIDYFKLGPQ